MKRLYFSLFVLTAFSMPAKVITVDQALDAALLFANQHQMLSSRSSQQTKLQLAHVSGSLEGYTDYYVFNREADEGFIIVSGDDLTLPVWGYSEHGSFDINGLPENMKWWLSEYQHQLQWLRSHPNASARKGTAIASSVSPLLRTTWDQIYPYNMYCPYIRTGPGKHAYAGCLATAMAQIMKYHNHPATGEGDHSYTFNFNGQSTTLSADFSQSVYHWDLMLNDYSYGYSTDQADAVAKLMSDLGISIDMAYGAYSSTARYIKSVEAFVAYFDYSPSIRFMLKSRYSGSWENLLKSEIDAQRPIYYFGQKGQSQGSEGHAFVVDGYDNNGYFHINWGWSGYQDGYFIIDLFTPGNGTAAEGYNTDQGAIIQIEPDMTGAGGIVLKSGIRPDAATMPANDVRASIDVESVGGPYSGTLRMAVAQKTGTNSYSWSNAITMSLSLGAGERQTVKFQGNCNLVQGQTYYLFLINPYNTVSNYYWCDPVPFTVGDWPNIPGDVNKDHEVNIADVNIIISIILGNNVNPITQMLADVNGDGEVNIADVNAVIDIILNN